MSLQEFFNLFFKSILWVFVVFLVSYFLMTISAGFATVWVSGDPAISPFEKFMTGVFESTLQTGPAAVAGFVIAVFASAIIDLFFAKNIRVPSQMMKSVAISVASCMVFGGFVVVDLLSNSSLAHVFVMDGYRVGSWVLTALSLSWLKLHSI